jgi:transcription elongation GreA/GreB family factor
MKRKKLKKLHDAVNAEISKAEVHYEESRQASEKMSETTRTSWSSAGDREYAMDQEEVTKLNLDMLKNLSKELEDAVDHDTPKKVKAPCFVRVHIDGEDIEFYLVENVASVKGFEIVSVKSPVGVKIVGKKKFDTYKIADNKGKIIGIE